MNEPSGRTKDIAATSLKWADQQAGRLGASVTGLDSGFAYLGYLILEISEMQYWRVRFDSFREYLKDLAPKSGRSAGQLQQYFLTVRDLSDTFTREALQSIGITKAIELRKAKDYALVLPANIVEAALDPKVTVKELKKIVSTTLRIPEEDDGDWLDCEMEFMVSPEERDTIEDAIKAAMHTDPVTKSTISKSAQMKDVMLKLCQEYLGAYSHLVPSENGVNETR